MQAPTSKFCPSCGQILAMHMTHCGRCGQPYSPVRPRLHPAALVGIVLGCICAGMYIFNTLQVWYFEVQVAKAKQEFEANQRQAEQDGADRKEAIRQADAEDARKRIQDDMQRNPTSYYSPNSYVPTGQGSFGSSNSVYSSNPPNIQRNSFGNGMAYPTSGGQVGGAFRNMGR